jgi:dynein heavy chain
LAKPPADVMLVTKVVCMLFGIPPIKEMNPETQKREENWWKPSKTMMMDPKFLPKLIEYEKDDLTQAMIDKIQPFITLENFTIERLEKVSKVAMNLAKWVFAMDKYYNVNKVVIPKKEQLKIAEAEFKEVSALLAVKQAGLKVEMDKVAKLKRELKQTEDKVQSLNEQVEDCKARLIKAESLINGLGGEKVRWNSEAQRLSVVYVNLTGDVLISSGMISYLGAFTSKYRDDIAKEWVEVCEEREVPNSGKFSLERVLGNPVHIRNWNL